MNGCVHGLQDPREAQSRDQGKGERVCSERHRKRARGGRLGAGPKSRRSSPRPSTAWPQRESRATLAWPHETQLDRHAPTGARQPTPLRSRST